MRENQFQAHLINRLKEEFPGCMVLKNDTDYIQGIPDLLVLYGTRWAALEVKAAPKSREQPNQRYYVDLMDEMSFAMFVFPENEERVFHALQQAFRS